MRQLIAILGDSLRESVDRRSLWILLALAVLPILFCASLGFETRSIEDVVAEQVDELGGFRRAARGRPEQDVDVRAEVGAVRPVDGDAFSEPLRGGHVAELTFGSAQDLERLAGAWFHAVGTPGFAGDDADAWPRVVDGATREQRFLEERFAQLGWDRVVAREHGPGLFEVALASDHPHEVAGGFTVTAGFGAVSLPIPELTLAEFVVALQGGLAQTLVGFVGMLIALSACGAFVPNMLQKGTLDLVLARPIGRGRLLLAKYVGGLWFVACLATFVVGGCWLGLTLGSGYSNPWFLASIVILIAEFAVLYAVAVLVGVVTRSAGVATLAALGVWFVSSTVVSVRHTLRMPAFGVDLPGWLTDAVEVAYAVLPKVADLDVLATELMARAHLSDAARARQFGTIPEVDWAFSIGTTVAFTAVVLALAVRTFRRRDW